MANWYAGSLAYALGMCVGEGQGAKARFVLTAGSQSLDTGITTGMYALLIPTSKIVSSTTCTVRGYLYDEDGNVTDDTTTLAFAGVTNKYGWDWTSKTSLAAPPTALARAQSALTNKSDVSKFSHATWNSLVTQAYNLAMLRGSGWNDRYATAAETFMSLNDRVLTAKRFNSLRYNIGLIQSTGITEKSRGDPVLASYFTTIMSVLNSAF